MRRLPRLPFLLALLAACANTDLRKDYPSIDFSPVTLDFGHITAGTSLSLPLKIMNTGRRDLLITGGKLNDDMRGAFSFSTLPSKVPGGTDVTITVTYTAPAVEGPDGARLVFDSNAANALTAQVSLGGFSVAACGDGETDCHGTCANLNSDDAHCGTCDITCTGPEHCVNGTCKCVPKSCDAKSCGDIDDGCGGVLHCGGCMGDAMACVNNVCVSCPDEAMFNACGVCAGPSVAGVGDPCMATSGCPSVLGCDSTKAGTQCVEVAKNACGACGGPEITGLGDPCMDPSGCPSTMVCNEAGTGTQCAPAMKNACGVCGGPMLTGTVGGSCMTADGCASTLTCNATGDALVCAPVQKNACGVCGGAAVSGVGSACTASSGCASTLACNATGDGTVCTDVSKNACGVCGGAAVSGLGNACTSSSGCQSTLVCNAAGTGTQCADVSKNACGVCSGPIVNGVGNTCTASSGCSSKLACNADGTDTQCTDVSKNACNVCGGPTVSGIGSACTAPNGCPGTNACSSDGTSAVCNGPITCFTANHVVISQISGYGPNGEYDEFIELYNPTSSAVDLTNYTLWYHPSSTAATNNWSSLGPVGGSIGPHRYLLGVFGTGANQVYSDMPRPDFVYSTSGFINLSRSSGEVLLWNAATTPPPPASFSPMPAGVVDLIGYGSAPLYDVPPTPPPPTVTVGPAPSPLANNTSSIVRKAAPNSSSTTLLPPNGSEVPAGNGYDTDNNGSDFVVFTVRAPRNSGAPAAP